MSENQIQVAVVDDDESFARAIGRLLRAAGFGTTIYSSAEAFLENVSATPVNCVVLDIQLGGMSGFDLARRLAGMATKKTPVIFVTALEDEQISRAASETHGSVLLRKPVSGQVLIGAIRQAVSQPRR